MNDHHKGVIKQPSYVLRLAGVILRKSFDLLYHSFAWSYDGIAWIVSMGKWNEWVLATIPDLSGASVLELGHGPGHLQLALAASGRFAVGLDESRQMSHLARNKFRKNKLAPHLVRAVAQFLPFRNDYFQQVVSTFPSDYIFDPITLAEVHRVLLPDGELIVLPAANLTGKGWVARHVAWLVRNTRQAPDWADVYLEPFKRSGYQVNLERRDLASSQVIVIKAKKIH